MQKSRLNMYSFKRKRKKKSCFWLKNRNRRHLRLHLKSDLLLMKVLCLQQKPDLNREPIVLFEARVITKYKEEAIVISIFGSNPARGWNGSPIYFLTICLITITIFISKKTS